MEMFDECELELIVCGLGEIDIDDWMNNTEYVATINRASCIATTVHQSYHMNTRPPPA